MPTENYIIEPNEYGAKTFVKIRKKDKTFTVELSVYKPTEKQDVFTIRQIQSKPQPISKYESYVNTLKNLSAKQVKNPSLAQCKKLIEQEKERDYKPTISHYRDIENGMLKTRKNATANGFKQDVEKTANSFARELWKTIDTSGTAQGVEKNQKAFERRAQALAKLYDIHIVNARGILFAAQKKTATKNPTTRKTAKHLKFLITELRDSKRKLAQALKIGHSREYISSIKKQIAEIEKDIPRYRLIVKSEKGKKNPTKTVKRANVSLTDKAIMLIKKIDRSYSGSEPVHRLSTEEKEIIKKYSEYFTIYQTPSGKVVYLSNKGGDYLSGKENGAKANPKTVKRVNPRYTTEQLLKAGAVKVENYKGFQIVVIKSGTNHFWARIYDETGYELDSTRDYETISDTIKYAKSIISNSLKKKNPTKTKPNFANFDFDFDKKIPELSKMFQGKVNGQSKSVIASDLQPDKTARIGKLSKLIINGLDGKKYELSDFGNDAFVSMDRRKNIWLSGKDSRIDLRANGIKIKQNQQECLGYLTQINYITDKKHIENGATVEYYHKLGEVNKQQPTLWADADGFLIVNGGDYDIWKEGIVN